MSFLLYVPRASLVSEGNPQGRPVGSAEAVLIADVFARIGLPGWHEGASGVPTDGPVNGGGSLYAWFGNRPPRMAYVPGEQTWHPAVPSGEFPAGRYWVGWFNNSPPTADDLQRAYPWPGRTLSLGDGGHWTVPTPSALPFDARFADDGSPRFILQRQFHSFGLAVAKWCQKAADGSILDATGADLIAFALMALGLNYRLTPELVNHLGLLNSSTTKDVFFAAAGMDQ